VHVDPPASFTDLPFLVTKTFMGLSDQNMSSLEIFCKRSLGHKDTCSNILLHNLRIDLHPSVVDNLKELAADGMEVCLSLEWDGGAEQDSIPLDFADEENIPFARKNRIFTNTNSEPWSLAAARTSGEQETLMVRLGTLQGDTILQIPFTFAELHTQWEEQYHYYDEAQQQQGAISVAICGGSAQASRGGGKSKRSTLHRPCPRSLAVAGSVVG